MAHRGLTTLYKKRKRILLLWKKDRSRTWGCETKEQAFGFLGEVEGLMSTGTTSSVGFARTFRKKKRGKTSAGIGKHKKETASVAKPGRNRNSLVRTRRRDL